MKTAPRVILIAALLVLSVVAVLPVSAGHSLSPAVFQSGIDTPTLAAACNQHAGTAGDRYACASRDEHACSRGDEHACSGGDEHACPGGNLHANPTVSAATACAATVSASAAAICLSDHRLLDGAARANPVLHRPLL